MCELYRRYAPEYCVHVPFYLHLIQNRRLPAVLVGCVARKHHTGQPVKIRRKPRRRFHLK